MGRLDNMQSGGTDKLQSGGTGKLQSGGTGKLQSGGMSKPHIVNIPKISDPRGNLSFIQYPDICPFPIKRVFYLYDVPADSERGGHAHYEGRELIIALSGAFDVVLFDGHETTRWHLDRPYNALYIPTGIWRTIDNFSGGAVCMVLTSVEYSEDDYIRDYNQFLDYVKGIAADD